MIIDTIKSFNIVTQRELQTTVIRDPLLNIEKFVKESQLALQYTPCDEYIELLKLTNGFEWNGFFIDSAGDFISNNLDCRELQTSNEYIVFGTGSIESYVYNFKNRQYSIANMVDFDEDFERFDTFGDMFSAALKEIDEDYYNKAV